MPEHEKSYSQWYPRYTGDYQQKTSHLSLIEHGAYTLLLDHYYATGKCLPANASALHRICRAFAVDEQEAINSVLAQYFQLRDDGYHNKTADEQLLRRSEISRKRREAAFAMHDKSAANADAKAGANAHTTTTTPTTTPTDHRPQPESGHSLNGHGWWFEPTDATHEELRIVAPGWDRQALYEKYRAFAGTREKPRSPQAAFLGWARKFTNGKAPS